MSFMEKLDVITSLGNKLVIACRCPRATCQILHWSNIIPEGCMQSCWAITNTYASVRTYASEVHGSVCVCVDCYSCSRINEVQVRVSSHANHGFVK